MMYYPINKEDRATGFLMPKYGSTTVGGFTLSNAFFWAINRSEDATFYHTWFKKTGQSFGSQYRFVSAPGSNGDVKFNVIAEREQTAPDGTVTAAGSRSYNVAGNVNQELPHHFRLLSYVDYFNNATTQQLYQHDIMDISQRTRTVSATVSGVVQRFQINATFQQNDVYSNNSIETASRRGYAPRATVAYTQKRLGKSRVYFGAAGELAYLVRQDNLKDPLTDHSPWRIDGAPQVRLPLSTLPFLTATTTASWRFTEWMESQDRLTGAQVHIESDAAALYRADVDDRPGVFARLQLQQRLRGEDQAPDRAERDVPVHVAVRGAHARRPERRHRQHRRRDDAGLLRRDESPAGQAQDRRGAGADHAGSCRSTSSRVLHERAGGALRPEQLAGRVRAADAVLARYSSPWPRCRRRLSPAGSSPTSTPSSGYRAVTARTARCPSGSCRSAADGSSAASFQDCWATTIQRSRSTS